MNRLTNVQHQLPGPKSKELLATWQQYEAQSTCYQAQLVWDHAEGALVTDVDGNKYLDWTSGVLVTNVGHSHPKHVQAVCRQAGRLMNNYDFPTPERVAFAKRMVETTPPNLDRAFFLTPGSEACEAAVRVAKRYTGKFEIVSFVGGFHGRTYAAMSLAGMAGTKKQYGPLMPGVIRAPFPYCYRCPLGRSLDSCSMECFDLMETIVAASTTGSLAAVMIEPYQGAAGFILTGGILPESIGNAAYRGCHDGQPCSHCFEQGHRYAFGVGWQHQQGCFLQAPQLVGPAHEAREGDRPCQRQPAA